MSTKSETIKNQFVSILVEEGFVTNEAHAHDRLKALDNANGSEVWFSNGVVEFKLVLNAYGVWDFYNFRNYDTENASMKRLVGFFNH